MPPSNHRCGWLHVAAAGALIPIYFTDRPPFVSLVGTPLSHLATVGFSAHWSLLVGPVLAAWMFIDGKILPNGLRLPIVGLVLFVWLTLVSFGAAIFSGVGDIGPLINLLQIVLPVSFLFVGLRAGTTGHGERILRSVFVCCVFFQVVLIASNVGNLQPGDAHLIAARFPQFLTYYPGVLALGIVAAWSQRRSSHLLVLVYAASILVLVPVIWSRLGLMTICLALIASAATPSGEDGASSRSGGRMTRVILTVGVTGLVLAIALGGTIGERLSSKSSLFWSGRLTLMAGAVDRILASPLYGDAGRALYDRGDFGGYEGQGLRLYPSHNQLLDFGIRGGILAVVLAACCAIALLVLASRFYRKPTSAVTAAGVGVILVILFASVSDLYFSQAITASPAWLMIGTAWGVHLREADAAQAQIVPE